MLGVVLLARLWLPVAAGRPPSPRRVRGPCRGGTRVHLQRDLRVMGVGVGVPRTGSVASHPPTHTQPPHLPFCPGARAIVGRGALSIAPPTQSHQGATLGVPSPQRYGLARVVVGRGEVPVWGPQNKTGPAVGNRETLARPRRALCSRSSSTGPPHTPSQDPTTRFSCCAHTHARPPPSRIGTGLLTRPWFPASAFHGVSCCPLPTPLHHRASHQPPPPAHEQRPPWRASCGSNTGTLAAAAAVC